MLFLLIGILLIGVVSIMAQQEGSEMQSSSEIFTQQKIKAGNYTGEGGQQIQIQEKSNNRFQLRINGIDVDCDGNLTQEQVQNKTKLKRNKRTVGSLRTLNPIGRISCCDQLLRC